MFGILHMDGSGEDNPSLGCLSDLYDELYLSGITDGSVSVINDDNGWGISAHRDGRVVFEHLGGEGGPFHITPVSKEQVLNLWMKLIKGEIENLLKESWKPNYL